MSAVWVLVVIFQKTVFTLHEIAWVLPDKNLEYRRWGNESMTDKIKGNSIGNVGTVDLQNVLGENISC
jgi:hypothetical protein